MTITLTPAAVALAAADLIERQGKADGDFYDGTAGLPPRQAPVDVPGAIAVVCGHDPDTWEDDRQAGRSWRLVLDTADMLIDFLALSHDDTYAESLGAWSDERDAATVVRELRNAALEVLEP
ncbi:DUF6197 family protein [Actinomadura sp. ATCC 39365]